MPDDINDESPYIERALILRDQQRRDLAVADLRRHLVDSPDDSYGHALLAACLSELGQSEEALREAMEAVRLSPDEGYPYRIYGYVLLNQGRGHEAEGVLGEAIRREPTDSYHYALLATIRLHRKNARGALETSDTGLALDPTNVSLINTRGRAQIDMGYSDEALETFDQALRLEPENAYAHTNKGWAYVQRRSTDQALGHFREALRLEPNLERARDGMLTAMRERYFLPGVLHRYSRWVLRLSPLMRAFVLFCFLIFFNVATRHPALSPFFWLIVAIYYVFAFVTYTIGTVLDCVLRFNEFGRYLLTSEQMTLSNWLIGTVATSILALGVWCVRHQPGWICLAVSLPIVVTLMSRVDNDVAAPLPKELHFLFRHVFPALYLLLIFILSLWLGL